MNIDEADLRVEYITVHLMVQILETGKGDTGISELAYFRFRANHPHVRASWRTEDDPG